MGDYYNLGDYSRKITTTSQEAQTWFDRGLNWTFNYNHDEAVACFERALAADPDCAMAQWGIAYAAGPNYNMPWELFDPEGQKAALARSYEATQAALALKDKVTPVERDLIEALTARYPQAEVLEDMAPWNKDFTRVMRAVKDAHPGDLDVAHVFVEAIMNETPWKMWDLESGQPAEGALTLEAKDTLEAAMKEQPESWSHPGLLHLYVHLMEMSPHPEAALRPGDKLRGLLPEGGHLMHMATHIDVLCGNYHDVVVYNQLAAAADRKFLTETGTVGIYTMYYMHNVHFIVYGAMFLGQYSPAIEAAERLMTAVPEEVLQVTSPPMADFIEGFYSMKQHVLIRFGKWQEILAQELPEDEAIYCSTRATMLYAKSVAYSALGEVEAAERTKAAFLEAKAKVPESRLIHNNKVVDLLEIAEQMLNGELEYRRGNHERAFAHLRKSVVLDDHLAYDEPWGWMQPTRHALGALLMEQGHYEEAEAVYRADLGLDPAVSRARHHPKNLWSLHGLHECLVRRGERVERAHVKQQLDEALARAEVKVHASCYCRQAA